MECSEEMWRVGVCKHIGESVKIGAVDVVHLKDTTCPSFTKNSPERQVPGRSWNCVKCGTGESPMLCLTCGLIHCGRYANKDALGHFGEYPQHCIIMNCDDFGVYCYRCDEFVSCDTIDRKIANVRQSIKIHNTIRSTDHNYSIFDDSPQKCTDDEATEDEDVDLSVGLPTIRAEVLLREEDSSSVPEDEKPLDDCRRVLRPRKRLNGETAVVAVFPAVREIVKWRGLRNLGNTCFMNAVVQALNSLDVFRTYFCGLPLLDVDEPVEKKLCYQASPRYKTRRVAQQIEASASLLTLTDAVDPSPATVAEELRKVLIALSTESSAALSPSGLLHCIWEMNTRFNGFQQQDSHELLRVLLDRLHRELRVCRVPEPCSQAVAAACSLQFSPTSSAISLIFEGALLSQVTCLTCHMVSSKQDPFLDLSLDLSIPPVETERGIPLLECIRRFFDKEELDACERLMCGQCGERQPSTKQLFLRCLPKILCLHLKRFRWAPPRRGKLDFMVNFPLRGLDMSAFFSHSVNAEKDGRKARLYDLSAVIVHHGSGVSSGHYTAFGIRDGDWFHYNDHSVKLTSEEVVLKQKAYLLFYSRRWQQESRG